MKVIKRFQGTVPDNKILDTYSTSNTDTYSCNFINKKQYETLTAGTSVDTIKTTGKYGIFNATGTLPIGYSSSDNNVFIECIMWGSDYGRQFLYDVRTTATYTRVLSNGSWQIWTRLDENYYTNDEQVIGKWVDGRTLYRKVFTGSTSTKYDHAVVGNVIGTYNIRDVIKMQTAFRDAQGRRMTPYYYDAGSNVDYANCWIEYHDGSIHMRFGSSYPVTPVGYAVIIEYTKN